MKILAIDPGTTMSGYVVWDGKTVLEAAEASNERLVAIIAKHARDGSIDRMAIEVMTNSHGVAVDKNIMGTVLWCGRFHQTYIIFRKDAVADDPTHADRTAIVRYLCGKVGGDKEVGAALDQRFPGHPVTGHCKAALAVGVYVHDKLTGEKSGAPFKLTESASKKAKKKLAPKKAATKKRR